MVRVLSGLFLIAHGLVHAAVRAAPQTATAPFDPGHSWLFGGLGIAGGIARALSIGLATVALRGFIGAGLGLFAGREWWRALAVGAAAVSLVLVAFYFHPWLSGAVALNAGIVLALAWAHWPASELVGA
jgi:hypothetical protein